MINQISFQGVKVYSAKVEANSKDCAIGLELTNDGDGQDATNAAGLLAQKDRGRLVDELLVIYTLHNPIKPLDGHDIGIYSYLQTMRTAATAAISETEPERIEPCSVENHIDLWERKDLGRKALTLLKKVQVEPGSSQEQALNAIKSQFASQGIFV